MGLLQNLNFGFNGILLAPNATIYRRLYLFLGSLFGFLSILLASYHLRNWYWSLGFLGILHGKVAYNLFVVLSLLISGLSVHRIGRRRDQLQRNFGLIWGKLIQLRNGLCLSAGFYPSCGSKILSLKQGYKCSETERENEVVELRKKLKDERKKRKEAMLELEREREASAWASEEAMAKIRELQCEKASVEREARQYRDMVEKKQLYDREVIEYLQLLIQSIWIERGGEMPRALRCVQSGVMQPVL